MRRGDSDPQRGTPVTFLFTFLQPTLHQQCPARSNRPMTLDSRIAGPLVLALALTLASCRDTPRKQEVSQAKGASSNSSNVTQTVPQAKVVFVKGTALMTTNADGSNVKQLVDDGIYKTQPRWSPRGDKIVYYTAGQNTKDPKTHANLVVITAEGGAVNTIPVFASEPDGTLIGGMRFVEELGWYGNDAVFAEGSANPYIGDYRVSDLKSGEMTQARAEMGFDTCASKAQVGYQMDTRYTSGDPGDSVEVNGTVVYTVQPPSTARGFLIRDLHWSTDCTRLAFLERTETSAALVVIRGATVEARVPLPTHTVGVPKVTNVGDSFVFRGFSEDALFYDTTTHTLRPAPDILQQVQQRENAEAQVVKTLGGQTTDDRSFDWWRPNH